jgi:hypothetical protein
MITYAEVKRSPTVEETKMAEKQKAPQDVELKIRELVDGERNKSNKQAMVNALRVQADLLERDGSWTKSSADEPDPDLDDPAMNPLGARPAPKGATRADEQTAPEPDSGSAQDLRAARAHVEGVAEEAGKKAPPPDKDAVAAKEGAKAADDSLSEEEYDDLTTDPTSSQSRKKGSARSPR